MSRYITARDMLKNICREVNYLIENMQKEDLSFAGVGHMKTIDEIIDQNFIIDDICSTKDNLKEEISRMIEEIIGEPEKEILQDAPYNNRRNPKLRNRLKRRQLDRAREMGFDV